MSFFPEVLSSMNETKKQCFIGYILVNKHHEEMEATHNLLERVYTAENYNNEQWVRTI